MFAFLKPYKNKTDTELIRLLENKDLKAFDVLVTRYQKPIYRFAFYFLKDQYEAEDVTQEVLLKLFTNRDGRVKAKSNLKSYLFKITKNSCIDRLRKKRPDLMEKLPEKVYHKTPFKQLHHAELRKAISEIIDRLPKKQQTAVYLFHEEGLTYKEISEIMDLSVNGVDSLISRARKRFRAAYQKKEKELV